MTPLDAIHAQLACSFCGDEIGRGGVIITEKMRMCSACGLRVKAAIEAQMAVERNG